jgi:hypothetical protein
MNRRSLPQTTCDSPDEAYSAAILSAAAGASDELEGGALNDASIRILARQRGMSVEQFKAGMAAQNVKDAAQAAASQKSADAHIASQWGSVDNYNAYQKSREADNNAHPDAYSNAVWQQQRADATAALPKQPDPWAITNAITSTVGKLPGPLGHTAEALGWGVDALHRAVS